MAPIGRFNEVCGIGVVRGGPGVDNSVSLTALKNILLAGNSVILAVDGPAGPAYRVKRGCVELARSTGRPIVHASYTCVKGRPDESRWDRWIMPLPFDTIRITYEKPYYVDADATVEEKIQELEMLFRPKNSAQG
jgi:lysophospholipid acyltransferase (LPLAT)-like uncharacterized protein